MSDLTVLQVVTWKGIDVILIYISVKCYRFTLYTILTLMDSLFNPCSLELWQLSPVTPFNTPLPQPNL